MKPFNRKKTNLIVVSVCCAFIIALCMALNCIAVYWAGALEGTLGFIGRTEISFESKYTDEELAAKERETASMVVEEGTTLLKNNDALPFANGAKITLFGTASTYTGGQNTGSSGTDTSSLSFKNILESRSVSVNPTVWNYYSSLSDEADWASVSTANSSSFAEYSDAAVIVVSKSGSEGKDVQKVVTGEGHGENESFVNLSLYEKQLISGAKAAGFKKVIVIIRSPHAITMEFAKDVDAIIICSSTGTYGLDGLGKILTGVSPSGHLIDTYVYDEFSSPAMQNFGDNRYVENGKVMSNYFSYVNYAEGVYVGYRYYETRYEDKVVGTDNVGNFDYASTVAYPFGYGLSYTQFEYTDFNLTVENGVAKVKVTVKNVGNYDGKDAVGVYFSSPYTSYDKANGIEKPSVSLAAFAKTGTIKKGGSETVELSFAIDDMKSYDSKTAKTYILDNGTYYITAASDAHEAVNNILAKKGVDESKLTKAGETSLTYNAALVGTYEESGSSPRKVDKDSATGTTVTNRFDDALAETPYLSRSNWAVLDSYNRTTLTGGISYNTSSATVDNAGNYNSDSLVGTREMSAELKRAIQLKGWQAAGRPSSADNDSPVTVEAAEGLALIDLVKADYNDARWAKLVSQMTVAELHQLFNRAGYQTIAIDSVGKPATTDVDGPTGLSNFMSGWQSFRWPNQTLLASTWNVSLAEEMGKLVAEDALRTNISGWYAPGINIHRTPFGGRSVDYYSEDPLLSGYMAANTVSGAQSNGLYVYIKHFALNEQETNRGSICTWANEQSIREIYLKPFEIAVKEGEALGLMDAQNRIGTRLARTHYNLLTEVLRNEWGFKGAVITDATSDGGEYSDACLAAGTDLMLSTSSLKLTDTKSNKVRNALQEAAKHTLYMVSRGNAMYALGAGGTYSAGFPVYQLVLIVIDVLAVVGVGLSEFFLIKSYLNDKKVRKALD